MENGSVYSAYKDRIADLASQKRKLIAIEKQSDPNYYAR
jgi:hypothetical protein